MRFVFTAILTFLAAVISAQAIAQTPTEAPGPFYPALSPTLGGNNLWGQNANNFENGCTISLVGSTFTPNCAVNFITITGPGQTIAAPTFTIPSGATAGQVKKSIELIITYSGSYLPAFAAPPAYAWPIGVPPVQCGTVVNGSAVTTGCLSAAAGAEDWIECRSKGTSGHVGCILPLTSMGTIPYTGPGDIVSGASVYWGLRAYSAAVAATGTQKSINIRRASDSTTTDINILTTGFLDTATATTFCASTTCFVATWYDQTGHGTNVTQATPGNQAQLVFNCLGTHPCLSGGDDPALLSGTITPVAQPLTMSAVSERTTSAGLIQILGGSGAAQMGFDGANTVYGFAGTLVDESATDGAFHSINVTMSDALSASAINIDGTDATVSLGTGPSANIFSVGHPNVNILEAGIWPIGLTQSDRNAVSANQHAAWGF